MTQDYTDVRLPYWLNTCQTSLSLGSFCSSEWCHYFWLAVLRSALTTEGKEEARMNMNLRQDKSQGPIWEFVHLGANASRQWLLTMTKSGQFWASYKFTPRCLLNTWGPKFQQTLMYRDRLKGSRQVRWLFLVLLLMLPTSACPCLQHSRNLGTTFQPSPLQSWEKVFVRGLVKFVTAVAYHFCLNLPETFSQPRTKTFSQLCTEFRWDVFSQPDLSSHTPNINNACGPMPW